MLHDLFKQRDTVVTDELSPIERKELLTTLAKVWGGMTGAPKCYSVHAGLNKNDSEGEFKDQKNNLILFANTAELRKGVLVGNYSWRSDGVTKYVFDETYSWFIRGLKKLLKFSGYFPEQDLTRLLELYYDDNRDNKRVYEDFNKLKEAFSEAGFPNIGKNLYLRAGQDSFKKKNVAFSLRPDSALSSETYWEGYLEVFNPEKHSSYSEGVGRYILLE